MQNASSFSGEWRGSTGPMTSAGVKQETPAWLIKVMFLGALETGTRSSIKYRLGVWGFSRADSMLGLWFSL